MGTWGKLPWDSDAAADWFGRLFDKTKLAKEIEDTLNLHAATCPDEIRAAASVLLFLGRVYIWPIRDLQRHLTLAADRLEEVSRVDIIAESPTLVEEIRREIQELRSRAEQLGTRKPSPPSAPSSKEWWKP